jgi:hypothetical protein
MDRNGKCIEIRTPDGKPLLSLHLYDLGQNAENADPPSRQRSSQDQSRNSGGSNSGEQTSMTDAQKRYLFRILAEQGFEGDRAHEHLKGLFGVEDLQEVSKREASRMIESLLEKTEKK